MNSAYAGADPTRNRYRVLIVDDNAQNLELLEAYMDALPEVRPITATNGLDALDAVASERPDLILLDVMMPKMSGFEVCKHVKGDPNTRDIPIIMVTALDEIGDVERARECGADGFISKPVNRIDLATQVRSLLGVRKSKNDHADRSRSADGEAIR
jgi:two-component system, OmpR family, alkaline phosphatase synthesis response regulator PhoP